jgi:hypothetical protein
MAALCALISGVLTHLSGTGKKLSASDSIPKSSVPSLLRLAVLVVLSAASRLATNDLGME